MLAKTAETEADTSAAESGLFVHAQRTAEQGLYGMHSVMRRGSSNSVFRVIFLSIFNISMKIILEIFVRRSMDARLKVSWTGVA